uniref:Fc receptor-like protein 1 isoform X3 n=1 Tax=Castor canadensis TaxID=51338 RepID=A0A8B7W4F3_CASCN|nr:Fc receptor-like protein 1 isoform X3 [Castor canadensis]
MLLRLLLVICELLPRPVLKAQPSKPIEGSSVILTCEIQFLPQKSNVQFQFCFYRDSQLLASGCSSYPELQIPAIWKEDSGSYWCEVETETHSTTRSPRFQIYVQRIRISDVSLVTQPPGGWVVEGDKLVLICLADNGTGDITFFWYRGALGLNLETKTQRSLKAEYEIITMKESDAEQYYCAADNGYGPTLSGLVSITVRIPVSHPVLTLRTSEAQIVVGDVVELHCEALRGSPPILYQFYHEDVIMGNSSAPSRGGVSFNLSLTEDHSGNYSCEANNGHGAQRSEVVTLNITVPMENRIENLTSRILEGLLGTISLIIVTLLFCYWFKRKIGRCSGDPLRTFPNPVPQEPSYLNSSDPVQLQPIYENVNVVRGDEVYSLVYQIQQEQEPAAAEHLRTHGENKVRRSPILLHFMHFFCFLWEWFSNFK